MVVIFFVAIIVTLLRDPTIQITWTDIGIPTVLGIMILSTVWSVAPEITARRSTDLLFHMTYFITLIIYFNHIDDLWETTHAIQLAATVLVIFGVFTGLFLNDLVFGVLAENRNEFGRDVIAMFPFVVVGGIIYEGKRKLWVALVALGMVFLLFSAGSRSAIVALGVTGGLLFTGLPLIRTNISAVRLTLGMGVFASVLISVVLFGLVYDIFPQRIATIPYILLNPSPELLGESRYLIYMAEIDALSKHWFTGIGYGAFKFVSKTVYGLGTHRTHDPITRIWLGGGIVPVLLFITTYVLIIRNYIQFIIHNIAWKQTYALAAFVGLVGITTAGMANIVINELMFYLLLAIGSNLLPLTQSLE